MVGGALAADLLARLQPLRFVEADGAADREAAFRIRYRAVIAVGMASADLFRDETECDAYDEGAVHVLGWDGDTPVATCRLVFPVPGRPLPLETAFALSIADPDRVVEFGRVAIDSKYRGEGHRLFMGLAARAWLSMQKRGFTRVVGVTPERLVQFLRGLGFPLTVLGPPTMYWGEERYPILCDGVVAAGIIGETWEAI
jgi:N-acyl-L-homoserine lactone synthetase